MSLRLTALALAASLAAGSAFAQNVPPEPDPEQLDRASQLIQTLNLQPMIAQLAPATTRNILTALQQQGNELTEETRTKVREVVGRQMADALPQLIPLLTPIAADTFTAEELEGLNEFFASEIGQTILGKFPSYQIQSGRIVGSWMQQSMSAVEQKILADLSAAGIEVALPEQPAATPEQPAGTPEGQAAPQ